MTAIGTVTGRHGKFEVDDNLVARTTQWAVNHTQATTSEWGDSDSAGYTNRAHGRRDATFTAEGKFDVNEYAFSLFSIGNDYVRATLWMGAAIDVVGQPLDGKSPNAALTWSFPRAMCMDFNLTVDMDTEEVIGWTASFGSDGIYYAPGATGHPDDEAIPG